MWMRRIHFGQTQTTLFSVKVTPNIRSITNLNIVFEMITCILNEIAIMQSISFLLFRVTRRQPTTFLRNINASCNKLQ